MERNVKEIRVNITQEMLDAVGEPIERAFGFASTKGLIFLEVFGGKIAVFNPELKQALRHRWDSAEKAQVWLIKKRILEVC